MSELAELINQGQLNLVHNSINMFMYLTVGRQDNDSSRSVPLHRRRPQPAGPCPRLPQRHRPRPRHGRPLRHRRPPRSQPRPLPPHTRRTEPPRGAGTVFSDFVRFPEFQNWSYTRVPL